MTKYEATLIQLDKIERQLIDVIDTLYTLLPVAPGTEDSLLYRCAAIEHLAQSCTEIIGAYMPLSTTNDDEYQRMTYEERKRWKQQNQES